jgi:hypothetical protein
MHIYIYINIYIYREIYNILKAGYEDADYISGNNPVRLYTYLYIYIYIHIYIYVYIHIYVYEQRT